AFCLLNASQFSFCSKWFYSRDVRVKRITCIKSLPPLPLKNPNVIDSIVIENVSFLEWRGDVIRRNCIDLLNSCPKLTSLVETSSTVLNDMVITSLEPQIWNNLQTFEITSGTMEPRISFTPVSLAHLASSLG